MLVAVYASVFHTYAWVWVRLCQGNAAFLIPNIRDGILMHTGEWPGWVVVRLHPFLARVHQGGVADTGVAGSGCTAEH